MYVLTIICEVYCMYISVMYCRGMAWHMHVLASNRALWDGMGHNVIRVTIILKSRLSRAYIPGELALAVVSVAVALLKKAEAS